LRPSRPPPARKALQADVKEMVLFGLMSTYVHDAEEDERNGGGGERVEEDI